MKKRKILTIALLFLYIPGLFAVNFDNLAMSGDDRLLFTASFENQQTLFFSRLTDSSLQQLTAYPEKLEVVNNGRTIIVQNRFGAARIPVSGGLPSPLPHFPSFTAGNLPLKGRCLDYAASPDGRWYLYIEPTSPAFGNLYLVEIAGASGGRKHLVSERVELPAQDFPVCWNPDSKLFVYSKNARLYYFPIIQDLSSMADERFRHIGPGRITSVSWGGNGDFYYFTGNALYRVLNPELFTRTIYGDFLSIGNVVATLPFDFECGFDRFWVAPDSRSILISKRGKTLFLFQLGANQYSNAILPHIMLPQGAGELEVFWSSGNPQHLTVVSSLNHNEIKAWRFNIEENNITSYSANNMPLSSNGAISPDGTRAVFWSENGLELWDFTNWRLIQKLSGENIFSCAWISNREFAIGTENFIEAISIAGTEYTKRRICLAKADETGFEEAARAQRILARVGNEWFSTDGRTSWIAVSNPQLQSTTLASSRFRAFLDPNPTGAFNNMPMIRNLSNFTTTPLFSAHTVSTAYNSSRPMRVALCFDLYDDDTGLTQTLNALGRFNIRAAFFMNGDFIRRNPQAAKAIVEAGHEAASLFYAPIDFSDARYQITEQFIVQGLARNEDEFFKATGRELSLIWHPPFFRTSDTITSAAATAGYLTARRDLDPGDWMSRPEALRLGVRQLSAGQTIEQIINQKRNGNIIPIRLGLNSGGRDDYLFAHIEVLIDALLRSGAEIVPVSAVLR